MGRDPMRGAWLARRLHPARVLLFARLGSTQRTAEDWVEHGRLRAPAVVIAARQTAGCGRYARRWWADGGSLCATFVLPADPAMPAGQVPLRAGLAVASVIARHLPGVDVGVKWPNDVLVGGRKIAGLLCARIRDADLVGIGINVSADLRRAPADFRQHATSLTRHLDRAPRRSDLLVELAQALRAERQNENWFDAYQHRHLLHNRRILVDAEGDALHGLCRGVDVQGRLLLDAEGQTIRIASGTIARF